MPVVGNPFWGVRVKPGDKLRSNVTYDTRVQSTYENMGIAVSLLVPDDENGKPQAPGVNPFKVKRDSVEAVLPKGRAAELRYPGEPTGPMRQAASSRTGSSSRTRIAAARTGSGRP